MTTRRWTGMRIRNGPRGLQKPGESRDAAKTVPLPGHVAASSESGRGRLGASATTASGRMRSAQVGSGSECTSVPFASSLPIDSIIIIPGRDFDTHVYCEHSPPLSLSSLLEHDLARMDKSSTSKPLEAAHHLRPCHDMHRRTPMYAPARRPFFCCRP